MTADIPLASLPPASRLGQIRAALEELLRTLAADCLPHELRQVLDGVALEWQTMERMAAGRRADVVELFRAGARLTDAIDAAKAARKGNGASPSAPGATSAARPPIPR